MQLYSMHTLIACIIATVVVQLILILLLSSSYIVYSVNQKIIINRNKIFFIFIFERHQPHKTCFFVLSKSKMASKNSDKTPKAKRKPATGRVAKRVARGKTAGKTVGKIAVGKKSPGGGFSRERGGRRGGRSSCPAKEVDQFLSEHLHTEDALISDGTGCNGEAMVGKKTLRPRKMIVRYEEDEDSIGGGDKATVSLPMKPFSPSRASMIAEAKRSEPIFTVSQTISLISILC